MSQRKITPTHVARAVARQAELDERSAAWLAEGAPRNTMRAYAADWRKWQEFCAEVGVPEFPATRGSIVGFVRWSSLNGAALATIDRRLAGLAVGHKQRLLALPHEVVKAGRAALDIEKRTLAERAERRGRGQATALTIKDLRKICAACPDTLAGRRDRLIMLLGFSVAARRGELANLIVEDVFVSGDGLTVTVRFGKTGGRVVTVVPGTFQGTDPRAAWLDWIAASQITSGPVFRRIDKHGRLHRTDKNGQPRGLSGQAIGDIIARACERAGLPRRTAHALRSGLATEARRAGHLPETIARQGGWKENSAVLYGYIQAVDRWSDNATVGIGL